MVRVRDRGRVRARVRARDSVLRGKRYHLGFVSGEG
jgi:hypothetical protein